MAPVISFAHLQMVHLQGYLDDFLSPDQEVSQLRQNVIFLTLLLTYLGAVTVKPSAERDQLPLTASLGIPVTHVSPPRPICPGKLVVVMSCWEFIPPVWPNRTWFPRLSSLLMGDPLHLPLCRDLLP